MSRASKMTLLGTSLFAMTTVVFVHFQQKAEQQVRVLSPL
jgi:protein PET117